MPRRTRTITNPAEMVTERDFQAQVEAILRARGWRYYHTWSSRHSAAGFPDLVCVRGSRLVFAELKREDQEPTDDQVAWLDAIRGLGLDQVEDYVFFPSGLRMIEELLR